MERLVKTMNEGAADTGEREELSHDLLVQFKPPEAQFTKPQSKADDPDDTGDLSKALAAAGGSSRKKKDAPAPKLWFGMIGKKEAKWIASDPTEAHKAASKAHCRIHQVFHLQHEAEEWLENDKDSDDDKVPKHESDDASVPKVEVKRSIDDLTRLHF
jgi:hypothetical protein